MPNKNRNEPDEHEGESGGFLKDKRVLIGLAIGIGLLILIVVIVVLASGSGGKGDGKKPSGGATLELKVPEAVEVEVGEWTPIKVSVRRNNCKGAVALKPLTPGVQIMNDAIGPDVESHEMQLRLRPEAGTDPLDVEMEAAVANDVKARAVLRIVPQPSLPREFTNSIGMKFVLIRRGKFQMGTPADHEVALPNEHQHEVTIGESFYMAVHEVTQKEYQGITSNNPSKFTADVVHTDTSRFPVEQVTHDDAVKFCQKLSEQAKEQEHNRKYRLPTEAEWEFAARGRVNANALFSFGNSITFTEANFDSAFPYPRDAAKKASLKRTEEVGRYKPNDYGLYDMHGNVAEWCQDWYGEYSREAVTDPTGPTFGEQRVARGGSWEDAGKECRSASRFSRPPGERDARIGIRLVCPVPVVKTGK